MCCCAGAAGAVSRPVPYLPALTRQLPTAAGGSPPASRSGGSHGRAMPRRSTASMPAAAWCQVRAALLPTSQRDSRVLTLFVAVDAATGEVIGVGHGRRSRAGVRRPGERRLAVVPGGRSAGVVSRYRRELVRTLAEHFQGARARLHGPVGALRQRQRRSRFTRSWVSTGAGVLRSRRRTRSTRSSLSAHAAGRDAQPLCHDHRRRGPPTRHRGRDRSMPRAASSR